MPKSSGLKNKGDALAIQVARNEPVNVTVSGKGPFRVELQAEVGAPGSGSWRTIQGWSRRKEDEDNEIEYSYSNPNEELQSLRLIVKETDKKSSISATMEVPAEPEQKAEPVKHEKREAQLVPASDAEVEADEEQAKAKAEAEAGSRTSTNTTTTTRRV